MILDTSAVVAILLAEADRPEIISAIMSAEEVKLSAASYVECGAVVDGRRDPALSRRLDELLLDLRVEVVAVTAAHAHVARSAYQEYGRGSGHRANLNYGDTFSYALAINERDELLFKGDDFGHTDVRVAEI